MKLLLLFCICFFASLCSAQQHKYVYGFEDSIHSKILGENRQLLIALPDGYNKRRKYPVLYLYDAESLFRSYTAIISHLNGSYVIPEMIVVGIINTDRGRDYTPTTDSTSTTKPNGGGEVFTKFMESELIPYIESRYPVAPYRILAGHSLSGLLVINTLLRHTSLFNAWIALDPSLWWNSMELNKKAAGILKTIDLNNRRLFLAMANSMPSGITDTAIAWKDRSAATIGMRSVIQFRDKLITGAHNLNWSFVYYAGESHGSVTMPAAYDALKYIFDYYKRPSFQQITDSTPQILENHYKKVSEKLGYAILPPASDISGLAWRSRVLEKNYNRALVFLQMYVRLYPDDANAYKELAEYYEETGDKKRALEYKEKSKLYQ